MVRAIIIALALTWSGWLYAQTANLALLQPTNPIPADLAPSRSFTDSASMALYAYQIRDSLLQRGYWQANVDTSWQQGDTLFSSLYVGPQMTTFRLVNGNVPDGWLSKTQVRDLRKATVLSPRAFQSILKSVSESAADYGFPFAKTELTEVRTDSATLRAKITLDKGQLVRFEPIVVESANLKLSPSFLEHYLGILPGQPYQNTRLEQSRQRLRALPFLKETRPPTVLFNQQAAEVHLFLEPQNASRFDFVIGVLPNTTSNPGTAGNRGTLITGVLTADFQNQFGRGERLYINAERLRPQTARIDGSFTYPYLLDLPFGVEGAFHFYRRDTAFLNIQGQFGVQYLLPGGNYLKLFWENASSRLITINPQQIIASRQLPTNLDLSTNSFGLEANWQNLDYRWNPRKGWQAFAKAGVGFRSINPNNRILELEDPAFPEFNFASLYDSLQERQNQYRFELSARYFLPFGKSSTLLLGTVGGALLGTENIYLNEQYRLGGSRRLRGFDEETVFASRYLINTLEYRLLTGKNAYFFGFTDIAIVDNQRVDLDIVEYPVGFGAGITFGTPAGQFAVSYAYGTRWGSAVDFSAAKIHFGYLSLF